MRTGRDLSPLLHQSPPTGRRPPYRSPTLPGLVAVGWLLLAAAMLVQSAYLNGLTIATVAAAAVAALFSLFWLQRAYRNLSALGVPELRDSPVSAVVWSSKMPIASTAPTPVSSPETNPVPLVRVALSWVAPSVTGPADCI